MKIFIVEASGGEYDGSWNKTVGLYSTRELAEAAIVKITAERDRMADKYPELEKEWDNWPLTKERPKDQYLVLGKHEDACEVWFFDIEEMELDSDITYGI